MNKYIGHAKAKELIEKFFDGNTSLAEEQQLYSYFSSSHVPAGLEEYRDMFTCLGNMAEENSSICKPQYTPIMRILPRAVAAAAAAILVVAAAITIERNGCEARLARIYGGSYVIKNGKRIDNIREIKPIIEQTLTEADNIERLAEGQNIINAAEQEVLDNISEKDSRERIIQILKN